jgi:Protein of unknown function (DUF3108)
MKPFFRLAAALFLLSACAGTKTAPPMPTAKDFEIPTKLADEYAVKEQEAPAPIVSPAPVAQPKSTTAPTEPSPAVPAGKVETKKEKVAKEKKKKKEKMNADTKNAESKIAESKKAPVPNRWTIPPIFHPGEHYAFDITYFGATAGELQLDVLSTKVVAERPSFHFQAHARTSPVFSLFYNLNDMGESFMDVDGLFSHKFLLKIDESLQQREVLELYDQQKHKVYYWSKLDHKKKGKRNDQTEIDVDPFTQDSISAFFYVRTLPLKVGDVDIFPVSTNGKIKHVRITTVRKETISTKIGEVPAIVVKPEVVLDGVLQTFGDNFVWISDDARRAILKVDAKMKVGSIVAYLREYRNGSAETEPKPAASP